MVFFKILKRLYPDYLFKMLPSIRRAYNTRKTDNSSHFNTKTASSEIHFFSSSLIEWNKSYANFKKSILGFIRPSEHPIFSYHNPSGIKLMTRLRLGFFFKYSNFLNERMGLWNNLQNIEENFLDINYSRLY